MGSSIKPIKKVLLNISKAKKKKPVRYEKFEWQSLLNGPVIGVDEVGRGCLAGPVFAAAVILPDGFAQEFESEKITDSKLVSEPRRIVLSKLILDHAQVGIGFASVGEIDRINILQASFLAMRRAIENLGVASGHLLVDGNQRISQMNDAFEQTTIIKGDLRALPISCASIVAKVARDGLMIRMSEKFPVYGFEKHKGYASEFHTQAIQAHGPCVHHRSTFAGVREHWTDRLDEERALDPF
jgi:ribonuclease HII